MNKIFKKGNYSSSLSILPKPKNPARGSLNLGAKAKKLTNIQTKIHSTNVAGVIFLTLNLL